MKEDHGSIRRLEDPPPDNVAEQLLNIVKAGLATVPFCGGIASLISDYIPSARIKRLESFAEQIATDLSRVQERVEHERIRTEEYASVFERAFRGVADFPQPAKREAFRGILVNSLLPTDLTQDQSEFFLNTVERLSSVHLRILRFMGDPRGYLRAMGIAESRITGGFSEFFPVALPGVPLSVIRVAFADLYSMGFTSADPIIFGTSTTDQGFQLLGDRLTPLGKAFVNFCTVPE